MQNMSSILRPIVPLLPPLLVVLWLAHFLAAVPQICARDTADAAELHFDELYTSQGVLGMEFSDKLKALNGKKVRIKGFMAPPLKADSVFFVLTRQPVSLCPFCNSEADWPSDIIVAYLDEGERFVQNNEAIAAEGLLEVGSATDPQTGFVSLVRLTQTRVSRL
ncbi:MAG: hypothetical protein ACLU98_07250 [Desulfovibrio fairfieldensis]